MSISAFGVDHDDVEKSAQSKTGGAAEIAGGTVAGGAAAAMVGDARDAAYFRRRAKASQRQAEGAGRRLEGFEAARHSREASTARRAARMRGRGALGAAAVTAAGTGVALAGSKLRHRSTVGKSAFGVEHGEIEKRNTNKDRASVERLVTGAAFPGVHGAIAGKKGKKLRAVGNEVGGAAVGSVIPGPGTLAGGAVGTNLAHRKGYYKPDMGSQRAARA